MKAIRYHEHGGPEKLVYEEVPDPKPGHGEILVRVRACSLNRLDTRLRAGGRPPPHILGSDVAGEVAALGPGVTSPRVGDSVLLFPGINCGNCEFCDAGQHNWCASYRAIGWHLEGGYAEYVVAPAINARPMPPGIGHVQAASLPLCISTAWRVLYTKGQVRPGDLVLIPGASSGVSIFAIQIAKIAGAVVITTTSSEEKMGKAKDLGADQVINYRTQDVVKEVRQLTGGRGVDLVIDHVGQATWEQGLGCLRKGGRMVTLGVTTGAKFDLDIGALYRNEVSILGSGSYTRGDFDAAMKLVYQGRVRPVIDRVFPLKDAAEAHRLMESGAHFGKIVLEVP
ncbi:MAG: zinc-binding dehydrogenase [Chloroflexi bacterium]|nr:zinc-binding dehydrogenase [Chloroflexota bacterium]